MDDRDRGFGWGLVIGLAIGFAAGVYLSRGPGRTPIDNLRLRGIELSEGVRRAVRDPDHPVRRAVADGWSAAQKRWQELEAEAGHQEKPDG